MCVCVCVCACVRVCVCVVYMCVFRIFLPAYVSTLFSPSPGVRPLFLGQGHNHMKPTDQPVMVCSVSNQETVGVCMLYVCKVSLKYHPSPPTPGPDHGHLNCTDQPSMYGA